MENMLFFLKVCNFKNLGPFEFRLQKGSRQFKNRSLKVKAYAENPRAFKVINKGTLALVWNSNSKVSVTRDMFYELSFCASSEKLFCTTSY
jgi:hypothetical protein